MADPTTPGDAVDNAKTDASAEADKQKAGAEKDGADSVNQAESDAANSANDVAKGGNVGDAGKKLADKEKAALEAKAKQRLEDAKQAALQMAAKNEQIAKDMAIAEAKNLLANQLGGLTPPSMGDLMNDNPLQGLGQGANNIEKEAQKLTDIKPSSPSV